MRMCRDIRKKTGTGKGLEIRSRLPGPSFQEGAGWASPAAGSGHRAKYLHRGKPICMLGSIAGFLSQLLFSITVDIQFCISFRCTTLWLDIYVTYGVIPPVSLVPTLHHA